MQVSGNGIKCTSDDIYQYTRTGHHTVFTLKTWAKQCYGDANQTVPKGTDLHVSQSAQSIPSVLLILDTSVLVNFSGMDILSGVVTVKILFASLLKRGISLGAISFLS